MRLGLLYIFLTFIFLSSCSDTIDSPVPSYPVSMKLDLTFNDKELKNAGAYKIYTTPTASYLSLGYGGVVVVHSSADDNYYAFDLACPYEVLPSVKIEIEDGGLYASCPKCGSRFDISFGSGHPVNGPATGGLRRFTVTPSGNYLIVSN